MNDTTAETSASPKNLPRIDSVAPVASTKWLSLQTLSYTDKKGTARKWDMATRTTRDRTTESADAVVIIPLLRQKSRDGTVLSTDTLLVEQYRPPVGRTTLEFPAGLIDKGETPEQAALRELREETGYVGEKCSVLPQVSRMLCMSPGLTDESIHCVTVEVDLNNPYNLNPTQNLDEGEDVVVKRVALRDGLTNIMENGESMPIFGAFMFALGLELGMEVGREHSGSD
uniref:Nudix hydrolase domain-containing protein n=1 Tax=Corethron hystrix TaxID=216773 RepID=A0A7S1G137_9STRA